MLKPVDHFMRFAIASAYLAVGLLSAQTAPIPVAWITYRTVDSLEKDFADIKAHGIGSVSMGARDAAEARQKLEVARRLDMKYHSHPPEVTEDARDRKST